MKKGLVILMAVAMLFAMTSLALAVQSSGTTGKGNIIANQYDLNSTTWDDGHGNTFAKKAKDFSDYTQNIARKDSLGNTITYTPWENANGDALSTHVYGTWNSPYTEGIDGYNYNDAQDYTTDMLANFDSLNIPDSSAPYDPAVAAKVNSDAYNKAFGVSGPHGGYLTSTHRCRECHAVHRAAGKFKLLRSDTRFEACDWCHGTGAGSGYNIQMDNDDNYTTEYNTGHTMGFGISSGKWKAPDDTYPAFTPNYWMGGFSCFDCHSPHANKSRLLGFDTSGKGGYLGAGWAIANPGHSDLKDAPGEKYVQWLWAQCPQMDAATAATYESMFGMPAGSLGGGANFRLFPFGDPNYYIRVDNTDFKTVKDVTLGNLFNAIGAGRLNTSPNNMAQFFPVTYDALYSMMKLQEKKPIFLPGSWLLVKNPDRELNQGTTTMTTDYLTGAEWDILMGQSADPNRTTPWINFGARVANAQIGPGQEIPDNIAWNPNETYTATGQDTNEDDDYGTFAFGNGHSYPVNKNIADWDWPIGMGQIGRDAQNGSHAPLLQFYSVNEFCQDCHDGNAGVHTVAAPLYSEDRALRSQAGTDTTTWKGNYDIAYGHDSNPRH